MRKTYFDHNATTKIDSEVFDAMMPYFKEEFGNPSSPHSLGTFARQAINRAREQVANSIGVQPSQIIFTSGGSEANNLFMQGAAGYLKPSRVIVSAIEHPCIMRPAQELARGATNKWNLRKLTVNKSGQISLDDLDRAVSEQRPSLISVMLANNETGVIQDVAIIAERIKNTGAWIHTDAIQAFGKMPIDFISLKVHAMTLSSHKIYGPKGAAALVIDKKLLLKPLIFGGGHENGFRSGTENIPAIVGFGLACQLAQNRITEMTVHISTMRDYLEERLLNMGATIFGLSAPRLPNTCYFALPDIEGETLVICLDRAGFAVASGAACSSVTPGHSYVLEAMGVEPLLARCAVRVSLGNGNTIAQIKDFLMALNSVVKMLKNMSTLTTPD